MNANTLSTVFNQNEMLTDRHISGNTLLPQSPLHDEEVILMIIRATIFEFFLS